MTTPVIIDIILAAVLIGFAVYGAQKGLLRTLAGLIIVIVSLVGAGMIAASFSGPVTGVVSPLLEEHFTKKVQQAMAEQAENRIREAEEADGLTAEQLQIAELLERLGIDEEEWDSVTDRIRERADDAGAEIADVLVGTVVETLTYSLIHSVLYILAFLALMLLLHVLLKAMDLVFKLPGLHLLNTMGGSVAGAVQGMLVVFLAVWLLRRFGVAFDESLLTETYILKFFTTHTPVSLLLSFL